MCGQKTISVLSKSKLYLANTTICSNCGAKLGTPLWSFFYMILIIFFLPIFFLMLGLNSPLFTLLIISGAYLASAFHLRFIPLIIKE